MNPWKLPTTLESDWTAKDHQHAANYYWYEMQGYNEAAFQRGECDANYKTLQTLMKAAFEDHTRKAKAKRALVSTN